MTTYKYPGALSLLCVLLALPISAAEKQYRVGFLGGNQGGWGLYMSVPGHLGFLGHEKGKNIVYEVRQSVESLDELPELAAELVEWNADVIVAIGAAASLAAAKVTDTTPIVAMVFSDPVDMGLVDGLARSGRNITGVILREDELTSKRLELLRELIPQLERVCVVLNSSTPFGASMFQTINAVASRTGLSLVPVKIDVMDDALPALRDAKCEALLVTSDNASWQHRGDISNFAIEHRLPAIYPEQDYPRHSSALISYGPDLLEIRYGISVLVDKILKGADPAELPMEHVTLFDLVVRGDTAKAMGIEIPQSILARAKHVLD